MVKIQRFGFWLTIDEKILISQLAQLEGGLSQAALIRRLIHQAALEHGLSELNPNTDLQAKSAANDHLDRDAESVLDNAPHYGV